MFVDKAQVEVKGGDGGNGVVSFRHEKFVDRGGPDGGDGGNGGNVILVGSRNQNTLANFRYQRLLAADDGQPGSKRKKHGRTGKDLRVMVPVGTVVITEDGTEIADIFEDGQEVVVAKGGRGGFGNAHFTSSRRQSPRIAEKGEPGQEMEAVLELKMIAEVGLVGLPNAGKSTLLARVTNAKPEIADYAFTTLRPNLGVADIDKENSLLIADIPGLIEGASEGKGLGDDFLRHVERTKVLIHVIDAYQDNIAEAYKVIREELAAYKVDLSGKPELVAINKTDGLDEDIVKDIVKQVKKAAGKDVPVYPVSAASGQGLKELLYKVSKKVTELKKLAVEEEDEDSLPVISLPGTEEAWKVIKEKDHYLITGTKIERFAMRTDFDNEEGVARLRDIMRKLGIMHDLERKGIDPDDLIVIGSPKEYGRFTY